MSDVFKSFSIQPLSLLPISEFFDDKHLYGVSMLSASGSQHIYANGFNGGYTGCISLSVLDNTFLVPGIQHETRGRLSLYQGRVYLGSCLRLLRERTHIFNPESNMPPFIIYKVLNNSCVDTLLIDSKDMLIDFLEHQLSISSETTRESTRIVSLLTKLRKT